VGDISYEIKKDQLATSLIDTSGVNLKNYIYTPPDASKYGIVDCGYIKY
jgi:hypothetical protein